ncbi:ribokinase [Candidatus Bathyarchaeota archaeon]|nr:ribokinase [Candidatus Bathyarchaeota archaeon]
MGGGFLMGKPIVTVVGSLHMDFTVVTDRLPSPGETVIGKTFKMSPGGKGANQAVASSRLGAKVYMVGRVGRDYLGSLLVEALKKSGVETAFVIKDPSSYTGIALITVDPQGRNTIAVAPGADGALRKEDVERAMPIIAQSSALLLQLEVPIEVVTYAAEEARKRGIKVFLNPAPFKPLPEDLYRNIFALTPNEVEASALTGIEAKDEEKLGKMASKLLDLGTENVVITLGSKGAFLAHRKGSLLIPAYRVKPLDTTGAGDAFNAALAVAVAEGSSIEDAVRFANLVAACKVTKLGAQEGLPKRNEVEAFKGGLISP